MKSMTISILVKEKVKRRSLVTFNINIVFVQKNYPNVSKVNATQVVNLFMEKTKPREEKRNIIVESIVQKR